MFVAETASAISHYGSLFPAALNKPLLRKIARNEVLCAMIIKNLFCKLKIKGKVSMCDERSVYGPIVGACAFETRDVFVIVFAANDWRGCSMS